MHRSVPACSLPHARRHPAPSHGSQSGGSLLEAEIHVSGLVLADHVGPAHLRRHHIPISCLECVNRDQQQRRTWINTVLRVCLVRGRFKVTFYSKRVHGQRDSTCSRAWRQTTSRRSSAVRSCAAFPPVAFAISSYDFFVSELSPTCRQQYVNARCALDLFEQEVMLLRRVWGCMCSQPMSTTRSTIDNHDVYAREERTWNV
jgi:hypothetical protein